MTKRTTLKSILTAVDEVDKRFPATRESVAICEQCYLPAVIRIEAYGVEETRTAYQLIDGTESKIEEHVEACQADSVDYWYCEEHAHEEAPDAWKAFEQFLAGRPIPPVNE